MARVGSLRRENFLEIRQVCRFPRREAETITRTAFWCVSGFGLLGNCYDAQKTRVRLIRSKAVNADLRVITSTPLPVLPRCSAVTNVGESGRVVCLFYNERLITGKEGSRNIRLVLKICWRLFSVRMFFSLEIAFVIDCIIEAHIFHFLKINRNVRELKFYAAGIWKLDQWFNSSVLLLSALISGNKPMKKILWIFLAAAHFHLHHLCVFLYLVRRRLW